MIPLGPWLPDQPSFSGPHLRTCLNVVPSSDHYGPFKAFAVSSAAVDTPPVRGAVAFSDAVATVHVFAGDETALYELQSDTSWADVTRISGAYSCGLTSRWNFTQFGDIAIATNFDDVIQARTMSIPGAFDDLAGSPPNAKRVCTFRDFFFYGYTTTSASEIGWSGINDPTHHTVGVNQCDRQILPDGGDLQGFAPTDSALLIFQQTKVRVLQYVGPPLIMQIDPFEEKIGCLEPMSICSHGKKAFWLGADGFYQIDSFQPAVNIGEEKINKFFLGDDGQPADANLSFLYRMSAAVDPVRQIAVWNYPSSASPDGSPDSLLVYYWPKRRWSLVRTATELIFPALGLGYTLEDLDAIATSGIDDFTIPLDDPLLRGGALRFGAFDRNGRYGAFAGATLEAVMEAGDLQLYDGRNRQRATRAHINGVIPYIDTDEVVVRVGAKERIMNDPTWSDAFVLEPHGTASGEIEGRFVRARMTVPAGSSWAKAQGYDFEHEPGGDV